MTDRKRFSNNSAETRFKLELLKDVNLAEQQIDDGRGIDHNDARAFGLEHLQTIREMQQAPQRSDQ